MYEDNDLVLRGRSGSGFFVALFVSLLISAGMYFAFRELIPPKASGRPEIVEVPKVTGMQVGQARGILDPKGLLLTLDAEREDVAPAGTIIGQSPLEGSRVPVDAPIHAILSRGQNKVKVPDVAGQPADKATAALTGAKLTAGGIEQEPSATIAAGVVIATKPAAGTETAPGTEVKLVVSAGAGTVDVPKVTGIQLKKAKELLEAAKLVVATKTTYDEDRGAYLVLKQDPAAGAKVAPGSTVNLLVNEGD